MSAEKDLFDAWNEWRRLAEAEGESIRARNWSLVAACQSALAQLQPRISRFSEAARREWSRNGADQSAKEKTFHSVVEELIRLQLRNAALLDSIHAATKKKLLHLGQAGRNLKQLRQSYGESAPRVLNSLS
jgi:hypothetical protein